MGISIASKSIRADSSRSLIYYPPLLKWPKCGISKILKAVRSHTGQHQQPRELLLSDIFLFQSSADNSDFVLTTQHFFIVRLKLITSMDG